MAKNKVSEWSATPANNTDIGGIDIAEGCAPSGINNAIRELMAQVKDMQAGTDGDNLTVGGDLTVTGTSTLTGKTTTDLIGDVYASNGTSKILESGTNGTDATFIGSVTGNATTATTATNIAGGGAGTVPYNSAAGTTAFVSAGTSGQFLKSNGTSAPTWANVSTLTLGTAVSPTGTNTVTFTSIPSWVNRITVSFYRLSGTSAGTTTIQLGVGGTLVTSGYSMYSSYMTGSGTDVSAFSNGVALVNSTDSATTVTGIAIITRIDSTKWVSTSSYMRSGDAVSVISQGSIDLSGQLNIVGVVRSSGNYDAGTINIMYE